MNSSLEDPNFVSIGNPELIEKRTMRTVPVEPGGTLADYVPFYFTPYSPMMYNIKTGWGVRQRNNREIAIIVSSLPTVRDAGHDFLFTDRHAYLLAAKFYRQLSDLVEIDFELLKNRDFQRDPDDPAKVERYQAEALIKDHVPVDTLLGIGCCTAREKASLDQEIEKRQLSLQILIRPNWYF